MFDPRADLERKKEEITSCRFIIDTGRSAVQYIRCDKNINKILYTVCFS